MDSQNANDRKSKTYLVGSLNFLIGFTLRAIPCANVYRENAIYEAVLRGGYFCGR